MAHLRAGEWCGRRRGRRGHVPARSRTQARLDDLLLRFTDKTFRTFICRAPHAGGSQKRRQIEIAA